MLSHVGAAPNAKVVGSSSKDEMLLPHYYSSVTTDDKATEQKQKQRQKNRNQSEKFAYCGKDAQIYHQVDKDKHVFFYCEVFVNVRIIILRGSMLMD